MYERGDSKVERLRTPGAHTFVLKVQGEEILRDRNPAAVVDSLIFFECRVKTSLANPLLRLLDLIEHFSDGEPRDLTDDLNKIGESVSREEDTYNMRWGGLDVRIEFDFEYSTVDIYCPLAPTEMGGY